MNARRCLRIADRINALLMRELGQGIDARRLTADTLYARDVLFVCEAYPGSELADLAVHFRAALVEQSSEAQPTAGVGRDASGFSASRFLNSLFGAQVGEQSEGIPPPARLGLRDWFGGSRSRPK
jgi:hypothetical protein